MSKALDEEGKEVCEGWYWAWHNRGGADGTYCIVYVMGKSPFLSIILGVYAAENSAFDYGEVMNLRKGYLDPSYFEFVSRIPFPIPEREKECQPTA